MARRGNEGPMDFQWQTHAPTDVTSPFHKFAMEHNQNDKKRPYSIFDSPTKSASSQPAFGFPQATSTSAQSPFRAPSFTTPRKPTIEIDFSSGPENQSSPEQADNEDTPEAVRPTPFEFTGNESKVKRNSLFGLYGRFAPSPGRDKGTRSKWRDTLERRVQKRRRRGEKFDRQLVLKRRSSDESLEDETSPTEGKNPASSSQEVGFLAALFAFIERYPNAPALLAKYLQLAFNAAILLGCLYAIASFWLAIQSDVNKASEDAAQEMLAEMATCAKNYVDNHCDARNRLPALESVCSNWELCMNRDPNSVKRAALSAQTFAQILNSFVDPISLKTMIFSFFMVVASLVVSNATFGLFRRSYAEHHPQATFRQPSGSFQLPGQQAYGMGQFGQYADQGLDWHSHAPGQAWNTPALEHPSSPHKLERARSRSPQKRIGYQ